MQSCYSLFVCLAAAPAVDAHLFLETINTNILHTHTHYYYLSNCNYYYHLPLIEGLFCLSTSSTLIIKFRVCDSQQPSFFLLSPPSFERVWTSTYRLLAIVSFFFFSFFWSRIKLSAAIHSTLSTSLRSLTKNVIDKEEPFSDVPKKEGGH